MLSGTGAVANGGKGEEAGEAWRGHGCAVPLQRRDAAFGLGGVKRRPYNGESRVPALAIHGPSLGRAERGARVAGTLKRPHIVTIVPGWGAAVLRPYS